MKNEEESDTNGCTNDTLILPTVLLFDNDSNFVTNVTGSKSNIDNPVQVDKVPKT